MAWSHESRFRMESKYEGIWVVPGRRESLKVFELIGS